MTDQQDPRISRKQAAKLLAAVDELLPGQPQEPNLGTPAWLAWRVVPMGWLLLNAMADEGICENRTCLRCRLADVLLDLKIRFEVPDAK